MVKQYLRTVVDAEDTSEPEEGDQELVEELKKTIDESIVVRYKGNVPKWVQDEANEQGSRNLNLKRHATI